MSASKRLTLFCVLSLLSLLLEPLQAYGVSPLSGLKLSNSQNPPGAKVFAIKEDSPALQSDLRVNDVITSIEGHAVNSIDDFVRVSQGLKDKESVSLSINRWGVVVEIALGKKSVVEQAQKETKTEPPIRETEAKTQPGTIAEGERIEDYFPIQDGARWQYNVEVVSPEKGSFGTKYVKYNFKVSVECKRGVYFNGREAIMFLENWSSSQTNQIKRYYLKEGGTLLYLGYETEKIWYALEPPVPFLRQPVKPPMSLEIPTSMVGPKSTGTNFKHRIDVGGGEGITVPAGRFEAIKVVNLTFEVTEWYAKGTGLVKRVEVAEFHGLGKQTTKYELVSYSLGGPLVSKTVEENTKSETEVKQKAGVTTPKKGNSLLDNEKEWEWVYTDPETGVRFAERRESRWLVYYPTEQIYGVFIRGEGHNSIDLTDHELTKKLLTRGKDIWLNMTRMPRPPLFYIYLYVVSYTSREQEADVTGRVEGVYGGGDILEAYYNKIAEEAEAIARAEAKAKAKAEAEAMAKATAARAEAKAKAKAEAEAMAKATAIAFVKKHKIQAVVDPDTLFSNPFIYKGEKVAVCLEFAKMTAKDDALFFPPAIVTGVPSTAFTRGKYTLAVRVRGLAEYKGGNIPFFGDLKNVTHLEYLGHEQGDWTKYIAEALEKK